MLFFPCFSFGHRFHEFHWIFNKNDIVFCSSLAETFRTLQKKGRWNKHECKPMSNNGSYFFDPIHFITLTPWPRTVWVVQWKWEYKANSISIRNAYNFPLACESVNVIQSEWNDHYSLNPIYTNSVCEHVGFDWCENAKLS